MVAGMFGKENLKGTLLFSFKVRFPGCINFINFYVENVQAVCNRPVSYLNGWTGSSM